MKITQKEKTIPGCGTGEQEIIDILPQTSEVFNRVLTIFGSLLIITASFLLMKRSRAE